MSNRTKNILATAALIGVAAIANSRTLTAPQAPVPTAAAASVATAGQPLVMASLSR